jgi:hypothetical protein
LTGLESGEKALPSLFELGPQRLDEHLRAADEDHAR